MSVDKGILYMENTRDDLDNFIKPRFSNRHKIWLTSAIFENSCTVESTNTYC